jgi:hypothetical protein
MRKSKRAKSGFHKVARSDLEISRNISFQILWKRENNQKIGFRVRGKHKMILNNQRSSIRYRPTRVTRTIEIMRTTQRGELFDFDKQEGGATYVLLSSSWTERMN